MENNNSPLNLNKMRSLYNSLENKKKFFDETGLTLSALHYVLNGTTSPTAKTIAAFAKYFNIPCGSLFNDYDQFHDDSTFAFNKSKYKHALILKDVALFYNE